MRYKPEPINPPSWFNPNEAYERALDLQGEPWINGGNVGEVVITPTRDQFTWLERIPKELSEQIWNELKNKVYSEEYKTSIPDSAFNFTTSEIRPYLEEVSNEWLDKKRTGDWEQDLELFSELNDYINNSTGFDYSPIDRFSRLLTTWKKYPYKTHTDLPVNSVEENERAYFQGSQGVMPKSYHNISGIDDFLAELAHPYQNDYGTIPYSYRQRLQQIWDETVYSKEDPRHNRAYNTPGYYEHETHKVVEPMLYEYVFDNVPLNFKKLRQNEEAK